MRRLVTLVLPLLAAMPALAQDMPLSQVLIDGEGWRVAGEGFKGVRGLAADRDGNLFVSDPGGKELVRLSPDGKTERVPTGAKGLHGLACGADGTLYACQPGERRLLRLDGGGKEHVVAKDLVAEQCVVTRSGQVYCSVPGEKLVYFVGADGKKTVVERGEPYHGLTLWSDEGTLVAGPETGNSLWALRVESDGRLSFKDAYYPLRVAPYTKAVAARGLTVDRDGRLYAATAVGVQIFDPTGRLSGVLVAPTSARGTVPVALAFGGRDRDMLYVAWGDKVYARKTRARAAGRPR